MKPALALVALLAACPAPARSGGGTTGPGGSVAAPDTAPRLVVLLVIDQFPQWAFAEKRPALTGGFARILAEGDWQVGRHPSIAATTGPGHALLGTGQPPASSGIIANEWWSRSEQRMVLVDEGEDGNPSSRYLRVPGLGDAVAAAGRGGKAVGVALKSRAALLLLGHAGLAVFYDQKTGSWQAQGARPAWLSTETVAKRLAPWTPLDATRLATLTGTVDAQPGEVGAKGFGTTFPHDPSATKAPFNAVRAMPLGNDLVFDTGLAAIQGERLGADAVPDLLALSLSAHDYIAHGFGHESWEAWDAALRLDARLAQFFDELDRTVGRNRWAMVVTSDHGGSPLPERAGGKRYSFEQLGRAANAAASAVLGNGQWIAYTNFPNMYLSSAALAQSPKNLANAMRKIVFALRAFPGLVLADRADAYAGRCTERTGDEQAVCLAIDPERSGDFIFVPAPGWILYEEADPYATAHGSLTDADRNVPVLTLPFGRTSHAPLTAPTGELSLGDVTPLVARWLDVTPPADLPHSR